MRGAAELPQDVKPIAKTSAVNVSSLPNMPGKIEGLAIIDRSTIAVINDSDFAIGDLDAAGMNKSTGVKTVLAIITLDKPLPN